MLLLHSDKPTRHYSLAEGPEQLRVGTAEAECLFGAINMGLQVRIEHLWWQMWQLYKVRGRKFYWFIIALL